MQVKAAQHRGACTDATAPACQYLGSFNPSKVTGQPDVERGAVVTGGESESQGEAGGGGSGEGLCKAMEGEALERLISDVDARKRFAGRANFAGGRARVGYSRASCGDTEREHSLVSAISVRACWRVHVSTRR